MTLLPALAAFAGGVLVAAQGPIYARLASSLDGNMLVAAFLAFGTATLALGLVLIATQTRLPALTQLALLPWWAWLGGLFGIYQVLASMQAVPRLGVTLFLMLVIAGNLLGAVIFDQHGWFGLPKRPLSLAAVSGILLVMAGVLLTASRR